MDRQEAAKLLSLIKLSYPTAYRDIDLETANATVAMWQRSFPDMPYPIMEQAFEHYRMTNKYPPTVAEMVEELKHINTKASWQADIHRNMENRQKYEECMAIARITERYCDPRNLGGMDFGRLYRSIGGENENWQRLGASRHQPCPADRLSLVDSGSWGDGSAE